MDDVEDLRVLDIDGLAGAQQDPLDACVVETFEQHALADHAGGAEDDDLHPLSCIVSRATDTGQLPGVDVGITGGQTTR